MASAALGGGGGGGGNAVNMYRTINILQSSKLQQTMAASREVPTECTLVLPVSLPLPLPQTDDFCLLNAARVAVLVWCKVGVRYC